MRGRLRSIGGRAKIGGMRIPVTLAAAVLATALVACGGDSDSDPTATPGQPTAATGNPTTTAPVDTNSSFVALVDLASFNQQTLFDGVGSWNSWFEPNGRAVNALVTGAGVPPRTVRIGLDGSVLADSTEQLQLRVNADGTASAYGGRAAGGQTFQTVLEVDGAVVPLDGDVTALPLGFSPTGERLLSYVGVPAAEGEAALAYTVHNLDGSVSATFTSRVSTTSGSVSPATWSPSGNFVATIGLDGTTAHDARTGGAFLVPSVGSTEWSPTEDALLIVAGPSELQLIRFPDLESVTFDVSTTNITGSFDPSGRVVTVSSLSEGVTRVFDTTTGEEIAEFGGLAEPFDTIGFEPVIMTDAGLATTLQNAPGCDGVLVIHPELIARGQCLEGANPRWAPDASSLALTRGAEIIVVQINTLTEHIAASGVPTEGSGTLARWNSTGTHLLLEWPWGGGGWTDSLP